MTEITRNDLLNNLASYENEVEAQNRGAWKRLMDKMAHATKKGERSVRLDWGGDGEFSLNELQYFKLRTQKEGMQYRMERIGDDNDAAAWVVIIEV